MHRLQRVDLCESIMVKQMKSSKKETRKERRERRESNAIAKQQLLTVAVPVLLALVGFLFVYLYFATKGGRT